METVKAVNGENRITEKVGIIMDQQFDMMKLVSEIEARLFGITPEAPSPTWDPQGVLEKIGYIIERNGEILCKLNNMLKGV